ncbi:MAG: hypothetical protein K2Y13_14580, partial [Burkholderiaceae bacterium]|nr:hypothetical protein [Burkholderiaceae bacterium]
MRRYKRKSGLENLLASPWWVSALMGIAAYFFLRWIIPSLFAGQPVLASLSQLSQSIAWLPIVAFGLIAVIAFIRAKKPAAQTEHRTRKEPTTAKQRQVAGLQESLEKLETEAERDDGFEIGFLHVIRPEAGQIIAHRPAIGRAGDIAVRDDRDRLEFVGNES